MRPEKNPLDLNNLPEDYSCRDGKQVFEEGSSSGCRKKKSGGKDGKDECGKVYECRFCSLKFCKSQALGGHMNRHRQERETEALNHARQLVFSNDGAHLGCHPVPPGSYHPGGDPFRSVYPSRIFSASSSSTLLPPQPQPPHHHQQYLYTSPSRINPPYPSSTYSQQQQQQPINDYYIGHVLNNSTTTPPQHHHQHMNSYNMGSTQDSNYTCIGAPVGHVGFGVGSSRDGNGRDSSLSSIQGEGLNWGRSYAGGAGSSSSLDPSSSINRFQDGF